MKKTFLNILLFLVWSLNNQVFNNNVPEKQEKKQKKLLYYVKKGNFDYPSQIIANSNIYTNELSEIRNNLKILYYAEEENQSINQNTQIPYERYLIYSLDTSPTKFIGMKVLLRTWPRYSIRILDIFESNNFEAILNEFGVVGFNDKNFYKFYNGVQIELINEPKFQMKLEEIKKKNDEINKEKKKKEDEEKKRQNEEKKKQEEKKKKEEEKKKKEEEERLKSLTPFEIEENKWQKKQKNEGKKDNELMKLPQSTITKLINDIPSNPEEQSLLKLYGISPLTVLQQDEQVYKKFVNSANVVSRNSSEPTLFLNLDSYFLKYYLSVDSITPEEIQTLQKDIKFETGSLKDNPESTISIVENKNTDINNNANPLFDNTNQNLFPNNNPNPLFENTNNNLFPNNNVNVPNLFPNFGNNVPFSFDNNNFGNQQNSNNKDDYFNSGFGNNPINSFGDNTQFEGLNMNLFGNSPQNSFNNFNNNLNFPTNLPSANFNSPNMSQNGGDKTLDEMLAEYNERGETPDPETLKKMMLMANQKK